MYISFIKIQPNSNILQVTPNISIDVQIQETFFEGNLSLRDTLYNENCRLYTAYFKTLQCTLHTNYSTVYRIVCPPIPCAQQSRSKNKF